MASCRAATHSSTQEVDVKQSETSRRRAKASHGLFVRGLVPAREQAEEGPKKPRPGQVTTMMVGEETKDGDSGTRD